MEDQKDCPRPAQMTTCQIISEQMRHLDRALNSVQGYVPESQLTRNYIVAQIEALRWVLKMMDVG
jgi:hypothetical protein